MRIAATAILTVTILGAAIVPGWCQAQPASRTAPLGSSTGATAAAIGPKVNDRTIMRNDIYYYMKDHKPVYRNGKAYFIRHPSEPRDHLGINRLGGGSSINPVLTGNAAALRGSNARVPVAAAATVKPAVGSVTVQPQPKTPDTNFSYGAGSGGGKKDVFKQPR